MPFSPILGMGDAESVSGLVVAERIPHETLKMANPAISRQPSSNEAICKTFKPGPCGSLKGLPARGWFRNGLVRRRESSANSATF